MRRRDGARGPLAAAVVVVVLLSYAVFADPRAPEAAGVEQPAAVEPPPGGIVASTPNYGWTGGKFSVGHDGAATYSLPLWMPEDRGSVAPPLSLSYSSQGGNGLLGVGWSLGGLPTITACTRTIAQDGYAERLHFDGSDGFCLGDNRLMPLSSAQLPEREYRSEHEMFARIVAYGMEDGVPNHFKLWAKDGQILTLGETPNARLDALRLVASPNLVDVVPQSDTRVTAAWAVNRIEDRNGNAATVDYAHANGDGTDVHFKHMRPLTIRYAPNRRVLFGYEDRPDIVDGFAGGVHTRHPYRMNRIQVFGGSEGGGEAKLREYRLDYHNNSITGRSLLHTITECDGAGVCKLALPLEYTNGDYAFQVSSFGNIADVGTSEESGNRIVVVDITGDGRDDLLYPDPNENWKIRHSTGNGFSNAIAAGFPAVPPTDGRAEVRPIDFDVDGRMDLLVEVPDSSEGGTGWRLYQSNGTAFVPYVDNIGASTGPNDDDLDPVYFLDLDGNGLPDFLRAPWDVRSGDDPPYERVDGPWSYRLNTGAAGTARFAAPVTVNVGGPNEAFGNTVVDSDGDGRAELIGDYDGDDAIGARSLGLNSAGGAEALQVRLPYTRNMGDFNGDGLVDAVDAMFAGVRTTVSVGNGAAYEHGPNNNYHYPREHEGPGGGFFDRGVRIADFNNDGKQDLLVFRGGAPEDEEDAANGVQLYVWAEPAKKSDFGMVRAPLSAFAGGWNERNGFAWSQVLDVDGDGVLDIVHTQDNHLRLMRRTGGVPDKLVGIGDAVNRGRVEVEYTTLADRTVHTPGTCTYPQTCLVKGGSVVSAHRVANFVGTGDAGWDRYEHTYEAARVDLQGRGWLGFAKHTLTRVATGASTVTEFDNVTRDPGTRAYAFAHLPNRTTYSVTDPDSEREYRRISTADHEIRRYTGGTYGVEPREVVETEQERPVGTPGWQTLRVNTTLTTYDAFGNADLVESTTTGGRKITEDPTFRNDTGAWLIGLPVRRLTTGCSAGVCTTRESTFDYDGKGNPTITVVEPNDPDLKLTTVTGYGVFGTIASVTTTDAAGHSRPETYEYENADKLHATAVTNAVGHRTTVAVHSGLGVALETVDPNGAKVTMKYDGFGRPREVNRSDGSFERITHAYFGWQITTTTSSGGGVTTVLEDQLGRERQRQAHAFDGSTTTTYTDYDVLGRARRVSRPALAGETVQYTTLTHDRRDRVTSVTAPDGAAMRFEYVGLTTHTYDAKNVHSHVLKSVDGDVRARHEDDPASGNFLTTSFDYGPFGEVTRILAPDGTAQTMRYDVLGRRERLVDPSGGTTTMTYNAFGEVVTDTNANGETTEHQYDALGRVIRTVTPQGTATNTWDTAPNGKGRLTNTRSVDGVGINHRYDDDGRPKTTTWNIEGEQYEVAFGYDNVGRLSTTEYPAIPGTTGRLKVANVFNAYGYLTQVKDAAAGGTVYWTAETLNGAGQLTRERYGNGVVTTYNYSATTGLVNGISAVGPGDAGTLVALSYAYDPNRNVTGRGDWLHGRGETFAYDELNRLETWSASQGDVDVDAAYTYDKVGNLNTETVSGVPDQSATYGHGENGAPRHALTSRNALRYEYDDAGRQVAGPNRTVEYNHLNLPKAITWGIGQSNPPKRTEFAYDANGERVLKRQADGQTVLSVPGLFDVRRPAGTGGTEVHNLHHILVENRVVAQVNRVQATVGGPETDTRVTYLHTDRQGSTVTVTNASGRPAGGENGFFDEMYYDPFGRRTDRAFKPLGAQNHGGTRQGYTGQEHDDELGLINMTGRIYDPEARRFLSPDPIIADPLSSQSQNRYSYVLNNPATLIDPTGHIATDGRGVYTLFSAGPSALGALWLNTSVPSIMPTPTPFGAPLVTHVSQTFKGAGGSNLADDDEGQTTAEGAEEQGEAKGDVSTIEGATQVEQINKTFYWEKDGEYYYLLPSEDTPIKVSKASWDHSKELARKGAILDANRKSDWTRIFPIVMLASFHLQMFALDGAALTLARVGGAAAQSAWILGKYARGLWIEFKLGGNLPRFFPVIDRFARGVATSIKSIDLKAPTYQNLTKLATRLTGYVDKVARFRGGANGGVVISPAQVTARGLDIAIQPGVATPAQMRVLNEVVEYGASVGVNVRIIPVH